MRRLAVPADREMVRSRSKGITSTTPSSVAMRMTTSSFASLRNALRQVSASGDSLARDSALTMSPSAASRPTRDQTHGDLVAVPVHRPHDGAGPKPQHASQVMGFLRVEDHVFASDRFGADVETASRTDRAGARRSDAQPSTIQAVVRPRSPTAEGRPSRADALPRGCRRGRASLRGRRTARTARRSRDASGSAGWPR